MAWWDAITPEQRAEFIIRYDAVEHATPVLDAPRYVAVVAGRDLHLLSPQPAALAIGELRYQVTYAPLNYIDLLPAPKDRSCEVTFWKITTLAAFLLGSGMGWLVHP